MIGPAGKAWMLGVCGMGVGPLAIYLRGEGLEVSGWDDGGASPMRAHLERAGVVFQKDFDDANPPGIVGRSSAVKPGNPLHDRAVASGCRLLRRGELLAERASRRRSLSPCAAVTVQDHDLRMLIRALEAAYGTDFWLLACLLADSHRRVTQPRSPPARQPSG